MRQLLILGLGFSLLLGGCAPREWRQSGETADSTEPAEPAVVDVGTDDTGSVPTVVAGEDIRELTVESALKLAAELHPDVIAARARFDATEGRVQQAGLYPNPQGVLRMETAPFSGRTTGDAEYVAGLTIPLAFSGRLGASRRTAELERDRARAEFESTGEKVRSTVRGSFATALYASEVVRVQKDTVSQVEKQTGIVRALHAAGEAVSEDVARAEMESIRMNRELQRAHRLEEEALRQLSLAVGKPGARIASVSGQLRETLEVPALESIARRLDAHPEVLAADSAVRAQRTRIELAETQRIPEVDLDLFYRRLAATHDDTFDAGISFPMPIFDRNQGRIREERALLREAEANARLKRDELWLLARNAHARFSWALDRHKVFEQELIPRAETVLRGTQRRYELGDVRLSEVLAARRERASLELIRLETLAEAFAAWNQLARWLGES